MASVMGLYARLLNEQSELYKTTKNPAALERGTQTIREIIKYVKAGCPQLDNTEDSLRVMLNSVDTEKGIERKLSKQFFPK